MSDFTLTRTIPSEPSFDVVVVGGGPSGCAAAIQAARLGARTLLVEHGSCLGGMGTAALVASWYALGNQQEQLAGGQIEEWIVALEQAGALSPGVASADWRSGRRGLGFNAEALKRLLDRRCAEAGVEVRFMTRCVDAVASPASGRVEAVVLHGVDGFHHVPAAMFIDASGDAVVADLVGAACRRAGRDTPRIMPPTLCALVGDVDFTRFSRDLQQAAVERAIADGFFSQPDRHVPGLFRSGAGHGILNAGHLFGTDALDQASLSRALARGRELAEEYTEFLRRYLPGCERAINLGTAAQLGVRESRRIAGIYEVDYGDYRARRHFPDQIAVYCKQVDIHVYDTSEAEYRRYLDEFTDADVLAPGESYGIPYGVLVPRGWANLWVPGRACSSDLKVNGAIRDQPACAMMGQAAGAAAVQCLRRGERGDGLDTAVLVGTLRDHGARLPQERLARSPTLRYDRAQP